MRLHPVAATTVIAPGAATPVLHAPDGLRVDVEVDGATVRVHLSGPVELTVLVTPHERGARVVAFSETVASGG